MFQCLTCLLSSENTFPQIFNIEKVITCDLVTLRVRTLNIKEYIIICLSELQ